MDKYKRLFIIFKTTFLISLTANSGYAILSAFKSTFVSKYKWITEDEMNNYIALSQTCPGPMAISCSTIVGYQTAGSLGAFASVLGCIIPPIFIMILVSYFYQYIIQNDIVAVFLKGMSYGVVAMLLDVLISLFINATKKEKLYPIILMILSYIYIKFIDYSIFFLVVICIIFALVKTMLISKKLGDDKNVI